MARKLRTDRIEPSREAMVLKKMRQQAGFSMREVASKVGKSNSYISHIENGRLDPPRGEQLDRLLSAYSGISRKHFYEKVRSFRKSISERDQLLEIIRRTSDSNVSALLTLAKKICS